jgi:hypothetical protein
MRKHPSGWVVIILFDDLSLEEALLLEKLRTKYLERIGYRLGDKLLNLKHGGEGTSGFSVPFERRNRISKSMTGRKKTEEHSEKIRLAKIGDKNPMYGKFGSQASRSISVEVAEEIKELLRQRLTIQDISIRVGVSSSVVKSIKSGKHWSC